MNKGKTIFAQVMSLINTYEFKKCVNRYKGDRHAIKFTCRDQFMVMSFAQFTDRSGLRDIETTLLQMDKAASAHKDILWNHQECRVHTDMDCYL